MENSRGRLFFWRTMKEAYKDRKNEINPIVRKIIDMMGALVNQEAKELKVPPLDLARQTAMTFYASAFLQAYEDPKNVKDRKDLEYEVSLFFNKLCKKANLSLEIKEKNER